MIQLPVRNTNNQELRVAELSETVFGRPVRGDLLSMAVTYQLAKRRAGTHKVKERGEVNGGGKKPFRQKGTGHARQGTIRAPHYRGGGIVFGPVLRDHAIKMPKKVRRLALQTALSAKREADELILLEGIELPEIKTRAMKTVLSALGAEGSALIVIAEEDSRVQLSARNLPGISVIRAEGVNVYDLLAHDKVIITEPALRMLEERLG